MEEENLKEAEMTHSLYCASSVVEEIIQKGAETLYDKYLQSILPTHEINTVVGSVRHVLRGTFVARDFGELWNDEMDEEPTPSTVCQWANGAIPTETRVVFKVEEDEKDDEFLRKTATKSVTSYLRKKMKSSGSAKKAFKDFKPKAKHLDDVDQHPRLKEAREKEKEIKVINQAFPHLDMEGHIGKLRIKVEKDAKKRKIENELLK